MKEADNFELALDRCLDAIRRGDSLADCLDRHPGWRRELEPLLRTALALRSAGQALPTPEATERIWASIAGKMDEQSPTPVTFGRFGRYLGRDLSTAWSRPPRRLNMSTIAAMVALLITLMGGGGLVYASQDAAPGQPLYQVREAVEAARVRLTAGEQNRLEMRLELAGDRLGEAEQALSEFGDEQATAALRAYAEHLMQAGELAEGFRGKPEEGEVRESILERLNEQAEVLLRLRERLQERSDAAESVGRAIEDARMLRERWQAGEPGGTEAATPPSEPARQGPPEDRPGPNATETPVPAREANTERNQEQQNQAGEQNQEQNREQERVQPEPSSDASPDRAATVPVPSSETPKQQQEQHQEPQPPVNSPADPQPADQAHGEPGQGEPSGSGQDGRSDGGGGQSSGAGSGSGGGGRS